MTRPTPFPPLFSLLVSLALLPLAAPLALAQTAQDAFQAHLRAGQAELRAGLPLPALREYRAAVRLRPGDADAHYTLAGVLEASGRTDEAMAEYRKTIALRPDNAPAHNALAGLLEDRGQEQAALAQYRQAVALLPSDPRLRFNLAGALADSGQAGAASAQYREALRLKPDFAEAAQALRALGPLHPIRTRLIAPSLPAAPTLPLPPTSRKAAPAGMQQALALARTGRLPEAIASFRALLSRDPRDAAARLHLGIALYADGQRDAARREWAQVQAAGAPGAAAQARRLLARFR